MSELVARAAKIAAGCLTRRSKRYDLAKVHARGCIAAAAAPQAYRRVEPCSERSEKRAESERDPADTGCPPWGVLYRTSTLTFAVQCVPTLCTAATAVGVAHTSRAGITVASEVHAAGSHVVGTNGSDDRAAGM
ncbi:hypothetical protein MTO96_023331 [Rhipicephalus appendiculatus]